MPGLPRFGLAPPRRTLPGCTLSWAFFIHFRHHNSDALCPGVDTLLFLGSRFVARVTPFWMLRFNDHPTTTCQITNCSDQFTRSVELSSPTKKILPESVPSMVVNISSRKLIRVWLKIFAVSERAPAPNKPANPPATKPWLSLLLRNIIRIAIWTAMK